MIRCLKINPADNVAVALVDLKAGETVVVDAVPLTVRDAVPAGHKLSLKAIGVGEEVIKYGYPIGQACLPLQRGQWVNEKHIVTTLSGLSTTYTYTPTIVEQHIPQMNLSFKGYRRSNGTVAIRNEVWIIPTVGCVNGVACRLAEALRQETGGAGVDAIVAFPHPYGCSQCGEDHENTRQILRDIVLHPHAGAVLVVGLGCENNQPTIFRELLGSDYDEERIQFLVLQEVDDEFTEGMARLRRLYATAKDDRRVDIPLSELRVGLKCGASDGFSGITANPVVGMFSDFLLAQGGTTVLTEVPEMFGAETILMNRCRTRALFEQTVRMINACKASFLAQKIPLGENPSPGNKAGGISTLEEKSLGCIQKGGTAYVDGVLSYGERLRATAGLHLLSAPGNDLVAATALASCGCHLILFTTGRGTPFGTFVPTMKIASTSLLAANKPQWIDFNAGSIIEDVPMAEVCKHLVRAVLAVASGTQVRNEQHNYRDIAILKTGGTL